VPEWPFNGVINQYDGATCSMPGRRLGQRPQSLKSSRGRIRAARSVVGAAAGAERRDAADPRCVLQIVKRHFARYTPDMVEKATGCPKETFSQGRRVHSGQFRRGPARLHSPTPSPGRSTRTASRSSAPARCCNFCSATSAGRARASWRCAAMRPFKAPRISHLYHSIQGYLNAPSALRKHDTLQDFIATELIPTGTGRNAEIHGLLSQVHVRRGGHEENQFGYDWHQDLGDHSHMAMFAAMYAGKVKGMIASGRPCHLDQRQTRAAGLGKLEWLVVKDNWVTETATY